MDVEDKVRLLILSRYKSLRAFCDDAGIIYTSFMTAMKNGLCNTNVSIVLKIANTLGIDVDTLLNNEKLSEYGFFGTENNINFEQVDVNANRKWLSDKILNADNAKLLQYKKLIEIVDHEINN